MIRYFLIFLGGGAGAALRYVVAHAIVNRYRGPFPLGTVLVNVTGCFAIGVLMTLLTARFHLHPNWRFLLITGLLGGYTTFSAFEYETYQAMRSGDAWIALLNVVASVAAGYAAVWLGTAVAGSG